MFTKTLNILTKIKLKYGDSIFWGDPRRLRSIFQDFSRGSCVGQLEMLLRILSEVPDLKSKILNFSKNDMEFFAQQVADKYFYKEEMVNLAIYSLTKLMSSDISSTNTIEDCERFPESYTSTNPQAVNLDPKGTIIQCPDPLKIRLDQLTIPSIYDPKDKKFIVDTIRYYLAPAENGDGGSQYMLGWLYENGYCFNKDEIEALHWYKKAVMSRYINAYTAFMKLILKQDKKTYNEGDIESLQIVAEHGDINACKILLGLKRMVSPEERGKILLTFYRRKAETGEARALLKIGNLYDKGFLVKQDFVEAVKWWKMAAEQGIVDALIKIGNAYDKGRGVEQNSIEAKKLWQLATQTIGASALQLKIGNAYKKGDGVEQDFVEAIRWWQAAARNGSAEAKLRLGNAYEKGDGVEQNFAEAIRWWRLATEQGVAEAQYKLGNMCLEGGGIQGFPEAEKWFQLAAEQGFHDAQLRLATAYNENFDVPKNSTEAFKLWLAAEHGNTEAQLMMGSAFENGDGVEQNLPEAWRWYRKAKKLTSI
jgi:TPR repeat protein